VRLCIESHSAEASQQLRLLELCFQYSFLSGRAHAGQLDRDHEERLANLRRLFEGDESLTGRRRHHRYAAYLPVALTTPKGEGHGILLNFSGGGMLIATHLGVEQGDEIQVLLGEPGKLEYLYTSSVIRAFSGRMFNGLACQLVAPPLELRARWADSN